MDVACCWDPMVDVREKEKWAKYQELAADVAKREPGYKVNVVPLVVGDLGVVHSLRAGLKRIGLLSDTEAGRLMAKMERECLCGTVRILRRHFAVDD